MPSPSRLNSPPDDLNKLSELQKQIVVGGTQILEEHRNETKKILSSHFYNIANKNGTE